MRKIIITGGCGFIGSNLIDFLTRTMNDLEILVLDNEVLGKRAYISEFDVGFVAGDIRDKETLRNVFRGAEAVIHLAADTRVLDSIEDPTYNFDVNVVGTFNVLNAIKECGIPLFVNASTGGAIIGDAVPPVHEGMVPAPISPYGASKLAVEGYCSAYGGSYGIRASSLRFSNVYGPRSFHKGSVVAAFFKNILAGRDLDVYGDGSQTRDYVFVEDIARGIAKAMETGATGVYQLGTGIPTSINQLIEYIRAVVGSDAKIDVKYHDFRAGEILATYCDISKARKELKFAPSFDLARGLEETWKWFKTSYRK